MVVWFQCEIVVIKVIVEIEVVICGFFDVQGCLMILYECYKFSKYIGGWYDVVYLDFFNLVGGGYGKFFE